MLTAVNIKAIFILSSIDGYKSNKGKINKTDCLRYGIACLIIRYSGLKKTASINVIKNRMN